MKHTPKMDERALLVIVGLTVSVLSYGNLQPVRIYGENPLGPNQDVSDKLEDLKKEKQRLETILSIPQQLVPTTFYEQDLQNVNAWIGYIEATSTVPYKDHLETMAQIIGQLEREKALLREQLEKEKTALVEIFVTERANENEQFDRNAEKQKELIANEIEKRKKQLENEMEKLNQQFEEDTARQREQYEREKTKREEQFEKEKGKKTEYFEKDKDKEKEQFEKDTNKKKEQYEKEKNKKKEQYDKEMAWLKNQFEKETSQQKEQFEKEKAKHNEQFQKKKAKQKEQFEKETARQREMFEKAGLGKQFEVEMTRRKEQFDKDTARQHEQFEKEKAGQRDKFEKEKVRRKEHFDKEKERKKDQFVKGKTRQKENFDEEKERHKEQYEKNKTRKREQFEKEMARNKEQIDTDTAKQHDLFEKALGTLRMQFEKQKEILRKQLETTDEMRLRAVEAVEALKRDNYPDVARTENKQGYNPPITKTSREEIMKMLKLKLFSEANRYEQVRVPHQNEIDELRECVSGKHSVDEVARAQVNLEALLQTLYVESKLPSQIYYIDLDHQLAEMEANTVLLRNQQDALRRNILKEMEEEHPEGYDEEQVALLQKADDVVIASDEYLQDIVRRRVYINGISQVVNLLVECSDALRDSSPYNNWVHDDMISQM